MIKKSQITMGLGALMLLTLFCFPLWQITLIAPQYPEPIGMNIWINKLTDMNPNDIKNINLMNHYIGMAPMPENMREFEYFPKIIISMSILGILFSIIGHKNFYLTWLFIMGVLGMLGMYDFWYWQYTFGHNLSGDAAIQFVDEFNNPMSYQPPLIGEKKILNFVATSYPSTGSYLLFLSIALGMYSYINEMKKKYAKSI
tara:strand:+ start:533 stop:1132 length:600 start_codon:yes stop_codon:yes gene_type:complete